MNIDEFEDFVPTVLQRLADDGYGADTRRCAEWVLGWFVQCCKDDGVAHVDEAAIDHFLASRFGFTMSDRRIVAAQSSIRKPLLTAMELYYTGRYRRGHESGEGCEVPVCMWDAYAGYLRHLDGLKPALAGNTVSSRARLATKFLVFAHESGADRPSDIEMSHVDAFCATLAGFAATTAGGYRRLLCYFLDWMHGEGLVPFSGAAAVPRAKTAAQPLPSRFTRDEVERALAAIDNTTRRGKARLFIVSLFAFTGMRAGDAINLKLQDIDLENDTISYVAGKTGRRTEVPIAGGLKLPLVDYLKNARPESRTDPDNVILTMSLPYTKLRCPASLGKIIGKCFEDAGVVIGNRHHGPHALRHSLASNMLEADVPVHDISAVLGHSRIQTTAMYLSVDAGHMRELALEVPDAVSR